MPAPLRSRQRATYQLAVQSKFPSDSSGSSTSAKIGSLYISDNLPINSPLFVPMIAESMKNKKVIITGIAVGVIGYAVGNYLGIIVSQLLKWYEIKIC